MIRAPQPCFALVPAITLSLLLALTACSANTPATAVSSPPVSADTPATPLVSAAISTALSPPSPPTARATSTAIASATLTRGIPAATPRVVPTAGAVVTPLSVIRFSAYETTPDQATVTAVRPDGTGRAVLDALPGHPWGPKLAPDGTRLLFSTAAPAAVGRAQDLDLNGSGSPDIWIANADGSQARQLIGGPGGYNGWSWSPDGRRLAFASNRGGSWDIYTLLADGTGLTRLTISPSQDGWPAWMPDGATVVLASTRSDRAQLYRMGASGGNFQRLLASPTSDTEPAISPNGRIAFSAQAPDGTGEIMVLDGVGAPPRRLTSAGGLNTTPAWSPDGARLAFVGGRDGRGDLFVVNADGSGLLRLTNTGQNQRPDWGVAPADQLALVLQQQVVQAESRLRRGTLEATTDDGKGTQTIIRLRFDLGDQSGTSRLHRIATTQGSSGTVNKEEVIVGDRAWQRQPDGRWQVIPVSIGVHEQVRALSPDIAAAQQVTADHFGTQVELRWTDANGADVTLLAAVLSGNPIRMRLVDRRTGGSVTVRYNWEAPDDINPPLAP